MPRLAKHELGAEILGELGESEKFAATTFRAFGCKFVTGGWEASASRPEHNRFAKVPKADETYIIITNYI